MSTEIPKFVDAKGVYSHIQTLSDQFVLVKNPPYVFPPYEAYPLAPPRTWLHDGLEAAVMDMDGTTTTTEALCIESLATLVSCMTGYGKEGANAALDPDSDYPHIIGNSTTRHVEYLMRRYGQHIEPLSLCAHFIRSTAWNMVCGIDPRRAQEAKTALITQGLGKILDSPKFRHLCGLLSRNATLEIETVTKNWAIDVLPEFIMGSITDLTRIGIEIYYQHYHQLLTELNSQRSVSTSSGKPLIDPMPAIGIALALLKGWLGQDAHLLAERIVRSFSHSSGFTERAIKTGIQKLPLLGAYFERYPVKLGLVTSSIETEARLVLREVFRVLAKEAQDWEIPSTRRERIVAGFSDPITFYDSIITASDSSEIRLKPHRDLYSIALHALGIPPERFHRVVGFEDSESGVIAIRAAGISLSCALPFSMTRDHSFHAATHVCPGGMGEVILLKHFFLQKALWGSDT